jgi:hypothetical protein
MGDQGRVDAAEAAAIRQYLAMRAAWGTAWGAKAPLRAPRRPDAPPATTGRS